jgi:hypothetical protein
VRSEIINYRICVIKTLNMNITVSFIMTSWSLVDTKVFRKNLSSSVTMGNDISDYTASHSRTLGVKYFAISKYMFRIRAANLNDVSAFATCKCHV